MNHKTDMQAELKRVASELRAYNPAADEYKGEHIHKVWAREIEAAIAGQSAGVAEASVELSGVKEAIENGGGFWRSCWGCYETNEGVETGHYPYSKIMQCCLGSGCSECGGIGAVWDDTDYAAMGDAMMASTNSAAPAPVVQSAGVPEDLLPNALWTRHGSGIYQWWSYKGYEARKDTADQWVLRKGGEELYRHTYLQVVMAHAEREILAAAPQAEAAQGVPEGITEGLEILDDFIASVREHGNYSTEATLTFIAQARQCFAAAPAPVSAPSPDREQVGETTEGCTPADAEMLRAANHSLAAENDYLRRRLRPFAQLASSPLSWAMVEYCVDGDPEKQTLQAPQMQRAFNRAADALREDAAEQPSECGEQECPHGVDDGACKQCYGEAVREGRQGCRMPTGDELRAAARSVGSLGTNHGDASHEYVVAGWKACMDACKAASAPTLGEAIYQHDQGDGFWKDVPYAEWQLLGAKWRRIVYTTPASAPTLSGGDGEVAVRAKTVHRRIDALCEAANTAGADYFDASTSMLIATRDLLTALGFPHRMAEPKEYGGSCEDCKWSAISGGGLCDGCAQAAEPKGVTDEERKQIDNALDMLLCAMRAANWEGDAAYSAGEKARALLANGE